MFMTENIKRIKNFLHDSILVSPDTCQILWGKIALGGEPLLQLLHFPGLVLRGVSKKFGTFSLKT